MAELVAQLKEEGQGRRYDALVGLSGGIDSAYLAHLMATRYGLRLLAVHVDAGWNSEPAVHNIEKLVRALDLDLVTEVIEWGEVRDVQRAFLRANVLNQDFPQDHAFFATLLRVARQYDVRSFLSGVNFSSENLHIPHDGPSSTDGKHVRAVHKADIPERKMRSNIPNVAGLFAFKSSFSCVRIDDKSKRPPINNSRPGDPSNLTRRLREGASNDKRFAPRLSTLLVLMVH